MRGIAAFCRYQMKENQQLVIQSAKAIGCIVVNVHPTSLVEGAPKQTLVRAKAQHHHRRRRHHDHQQPRRPRFSQEDPHAHHHAHKHSHRNIDTYTYMCTYATHQSK